MISILTIFISSYREDPESKIVFTLKINSIFLLGLDINAIYNILNSIFNHYPILYFNQSRRSYQLIFSLAPL